MESKINDTFLKLIKDICYFGDIDEPEIAIRVGRNAKYISQLKSRIKKNIDVPESFVNLLRLTFAKELELKSDIITKKSEAAKEIGVLNEKVIDLQAKVDVLLVIVSERTNDLKTGGFSISPDIQKAINLRRERIFYESSQEQEPEQ